MTTTELRITGMDCADCAMTLEKAVSRIEGVQLCRVNFPTGKMQIEGAPDSATVKSRIEALGYGIADKPQAINERPSGWRGFFSYMLDRRETRIVMIGLVLLAISLTGKAMNAPDLLVHGLELAIIVGAGFPIIRRGINQFIATREITINLLMSIATIGAVIIGEWEEAATVILLFAIGEALEGYSADRVRGALHSLMTLAPEEALVMRPCMDCEGHMGKDGYTGGPCPWCGTHEQAVSVEDVAVGETMMIIPGSRIPLDGTILSGASSVNQAPITGESIPVEKAAGDPVYAGTINGAGAMQVEVTAPVGDSTLARIVKLVEEAQAQKAPSERFVNQFAKWYTPAVIVIAVLVASVPPLLFDAKFETWLYRALTLLVVACPCALVISTPVAVVSAMVRAARQGILIKGGQYLEALAWLKAIAFDKTGTLTTGQPQVIKMQSINCNGDPNCESCDSMLALASAVERQSEHPLGRAVVQAARDRGVFDRHEPAQAVTAMAGRGIQGQVGNRPITIGSHPLFDEHYPHTERVCADIAGYEKQGQTVMLVADQAEVIGFISVADTLRESAKQAMRELPHLHKIMLTGDNATAAAAIAKEVGMDEFKANLLPQDKVAMVKQLTERYQHVAMVGDGVNDAPALAAATVGIAMGGAGTAQALETADVVLMQDDLSQLPAAIRISQRAGQIIRQNVGISLITKLVFLALTLPGLTTLWMAVFADTGISLLVTLNGMRLLRNQEQA